MPSPSELVKELRRHGIPADRALGYPSSSGRVLTITGQFVSNHDHGRGISMTAKAAGSTIRRTRLASTIAGVCIALGAAACATTEMAPVKTSPSGFLGKDYALLSPGEVSKGQAGLRYFNPTAQWRGYRKIMIEPVTFWGDETSKVAPSDQQALGTYFNGSLEKALAEKFPIVNSPGPDVMKLQVAVTDAESATPGLRTISLVVPQARLLNTVQSLATGKQLFAGSLQVEAKLTDATTGKLLSAAVARGVGGGSVKAAAQVQWGDAENAMDLFARRTAKGLAALTSGTATPADLPLPE